MLQQEIFSEFQITGFSDLLEQDPFVSWGLPVSWGGWQGGGCSWAGQIEGQCFTIEETGADSG